MIHLRLMTSRPPLSPVKGSRRGRHERGLSRYDGNAHPLRYDPGTRAGQSGKQEERIPAAAGGLDVPEGAGVAGRGLAGGAGLPQGWAVPGGGGGPGGPDLSLEGERSMITVGVLRGSVSY